MKQFLKTLLGLFVYCCTLCVVLAALGFWWGAQQFTKPGSHTAPFELLIEKGDTIGDVSAKLQQNGALTHPLIFNIMGRITGQATRIKAGDYDIPAHSSMKELLKILEDGKTIQRMITIPEGLTSFEITQLIAQAPHLKQQPLSQIPAEGSLLPETYHFVRGESNIDIITRMQQDMTRTIDTLWETRTPGLAFASKQEALTLASIVEKETGQKDERAKIAGVFINRLRLGMPLQTDPTVIYAITQGRPQNEGQGPIGRRLLRTDLDIDSPYNTYKYPGLPPTPIANPGRAAIAATLQPEAHKYLYFVADGTGGHAFAETLEGHNANVAKWRVIRKQQEAAVPQSSSAPSSSE